MKTSKGMAPLEVYTWKAYRNYYRALRTTCYSNYDLNEALRIYQEMLEALFLGKMKPGDQFDDKIGISYDDDILRTELVEIVYLSMEYDRADLLNEAYVRLKNGNTNLRDIHGKLMSIHFKDDDGSAAAAAIKAQKRRMSKILEDAVMDIAEGLGAEATEESYQESLEKIFDKKKRDALFLEKWDEEYPLIELTAGDIEEMGKLLLLNSDIHEDILWTKKHLKKVE